MSRNSKLAEALRKNRERSSGQFLPFFKFPSGKTVIRILPASAKDDDGDWFLPVGFHYNVDDKRPITCRYETQWAEDNCPVCDMVRELRSDGMNDEAGRIALRRQFIVRAIVRGEEDKGAQMIRLPSTLFQAVGEIIRDEETFGDVLHPGPKGRDIIVVKTGANLQTEYQANAHPKNVPALPTPEETKALISAFPVIADLVTVPDEEEVAGVLKAKFGYVSAMGDVYEEEDDDDDNTSWEGDNDVPYGGGVETTEENAPSEPEAKEDDGALDAWMASDGEEEDDGPSVSELARADQEGAKVSGLKDDLKDKKTPPKKRRGRTKKTQPVA
jgi:hypothetical protein